MDHFDEINPAYGRVFVPGRLSLGVVVPIEAYPGGPVPTLERHVERARLVESLGFKALWVRDVPFNVPSFGDAGQTHDPFVYLGFLAAQTRQIALGVASVILPLRHPAHVAKAAASIDVLSGGRLLLGVASGDRPREYPALNLSFEDRGERFRQSFDYIQRMSGDAPAFESSYGRPDQGMDMLPKPFGPRLPVLVTGGSQQSPDWIAGHGDGWMIYPRAAEAQAHIVRRYRQGLAAAGRGERPVMQPLYLDLDDDPGAIARPIHLGIRTGSRHLRSYLHQLEAAGINHVALNLRFQHGEVESALHRIADEILIDFPREQDAQP